LIIEGRLVGVTNGELLGGLLMRGHTVGVTNERGSPGDDQ
jgi:hypothetical protein